MYTPGAAAESASAEKKSIFEQISATYLLYFVPLTIWTQGPICEEGSSILKELGRLEVWQSSFFFKEKTTPLFQKLLSFFKEFLWPSEDSIPRALEPLSTMHANWN